MACALLPAKTTSAHWLAHRAFTDAVERFLEREDAGVASYIFLSHSWGMALQIGQKLSSLGPIFAF